MFSNSVIGWAVQRMIRPTIAEAPLAALNRRLQGYPRNHTYRVRGNDMVPSRKLRQRAASISRALPHRLGSFLDIGSCKGYFVLQASVSESCPVAVGIDVHEPFVSVSNEVRDRLHRPNAAFHRASLEEVAASPERFGGPFRTVQLVSTYHYLFWGSHLEGKSFARHEAILALLARICDRFLIFASPLEIEDCPHSIQERARAEGPRDYSRGAFVVAADHLFDIVSIGFMDRKRKRPLLLLINRLSAHP